MHAPSQEVIAENQLLESLQPFSWSNDGFSNPVEVLKNIDPLGKEKVVHYRSKVDLLKVNLAVDKAHAVASEFKDDGLGASLCDTRLGDADA